jgi:cytochrome c553
MKKIALSLLLVSAALMAAEDGATLYKKCSSCHGLQAEKKALNQSQVIAGWDAAKTEAALKGYKDGSYGGKMKGLMKGQVGSYNDAQIAAVSAYIATIK